MDRTIWGALLTTGLVFVAAPASAHDYYDRHARQHYRLEEEHARQDQRLDDIHDEAHYYGMTPRQHARLHRRLDRAEHRTHDRLEQQHDRQHRYYGGYYGDW